MSRQMYFEARSTYLLKRPIEVGDLARALDVPGEGLRSFKIHRGLALEAAIALRRECVRERRGDRQSHPTSELSLLRLVQVVGWKQVALDDPTRSTYDTKKLEFQK